VTMAVLREMASACLAAKAASVLEVPAWKRTGVRWREGWTWLRPEGLRYFPVIRVSGG
jgi:hypothetical protein